MKNDKLLLQTFLFATAFSSISMQAGATEYKYPNFSNISGLTMIGNTATASTSDGTVLRVTPAMGSQSGAAYLTTPVTLGTSDTFSTKFQFRFTSPGGWDPADGITFVLAASPTGLGGNGVGIGYAGVPNSVAIEFDTYNNAGYGLGDDDGNSSNHISIDTDGNLTNAALANVYGNASCGFPSGNPGQNTYTAAGCMSNGNLWTATINYNGSLLSVNVSDPAESSSFTAVNQHQIDIASYLGTNSAYVGFTSGTGAGWENHDIVNWDFANTATLPTTATPEPTSLTLLVAGLLAGAGLIRRNKSI